MPERTLVTGGAGFVGLRLVRALLERGDHVTMVDDFSRGVRDAELAELLDDVELVEHDLTKPLPEKGLAPGCTSVYHCAAIVGVRAAGERPYDVLRVNVAATTNVLDWARRAEPEQLFFSSTSEITDGAVRVGLMGLPVGEDGPVVIDDLTRPRSSYAISKLTGEALFLAYAGATGARVRIARYFSVYGPRMGHDHVIPQITGRILDRMDPLPVYGARQSRAFCFVDDAVDATIRLMGVPGEEPVIAMVGNDQEEIVIEDLVRKLCAIAQHDPELDVHEPPPGSPERRRPDISRLRELTGFEPRVDLDEGLRRSFEWYRADRAGSAQAIGG